jgi:transposase
MVLPTEQWMQLRRSRALREAEISISQIARETGLDRRTVAKYWQPRSPAGRIGPHRGVVGSGRPSSLTRT